MPARPPSPAAGASTLGTSYRQLGASFLLTTEGEFGAALEALRHGMAQTESTWQQAAGSMTAI